MENSSQNDEENQLDDEGITGSKEVIFLVGSKNVEVKANKAILAKNFEVFK